MNTLEPQNNTDGKPTQLGVSSHLLPNRVTERIPVGQIFGFRKTTAGAGGVKLENLDFVLSNNKSLLLESTTKDNYGAVSITNTAQFWIVLGEANTFFVKSNNQDLGAVSAGSFVVGNPYTIASIGTTDFTLIGAVDNLVGVDFVSTGVGLGTGTATTKVNLFTASFKNGAFTSKNGFLVGGHFDTSANPLTKGVRIIPLTFTVTGLGAGATTAEQTFAFASAGTNYSTSNMLDVPNSVLAVTTGIKTPNSTIVTGIDVQTYTYSKTGFLWKATNTSAGSETFNIDFIVVAW